MTGVLLTTGNLNRLVTVQRLKEGTAVDAAGHIDETDPSSWRNLSKRWVKLTPRGSREFFRGEQLASEITHQIDMRYDSDSLKITTRDRLMLGERIFSLASPGINVDDGNVILRFPATEVP